MFAGQYPPQRSLNDAARIRADAEQLIQLGQQALEGLATDPGAIALGMALSGASEKVVELAKVWRSFPPGEDCERSAQALRDAVADLLALEQRADQRAIAH
jgi:hypothetical protein